MMTPSLKTAIILCEYYLEVKPIYGMFEKLKKTPIIRFPIYIAPKRIENLETEVPQVENWNPAVKPNFELDMTPLNYSYCYHATEVSVRDDEETKK